MTRVHSNEDGTDQYLRRGVEKFGQSVHTSATDASLNYNVQNQADFDLDDGEALTDPTIACEDFVRWSGARISEEVKSSEEACRQGLQAGVFVEPDNQLVILERVQDVL